MRLLCSLAATAALVACATPRSPELLPFAREVWVVDKVPLGCKSVGSVSARACATSEEDARERAIIEIRNHTAGLGGTGSAVQQTGSYQVGKKEKCVVLSGKALTCQARSGMDRSAGDSWVPSPPH